MEQEAELLVRYRREQDPEAFRELVEGHQDMVYAACWRILGNRADAEDAAQDCFFRLARHAAKLKAPIAGWLHTVAVRVSLDVLRKRKSLQARERKAARLEARKRRRAEPTWDDVKGAVDTAIAQLPPKLRVPLVLYYLEQHRQEDIARELGISQPAVSQRLKRAVTALRRRLRSAGYTSLESALAPLLAGQAVQAAPATLTAALGKMAIAGISSGGAGAAVAGALSAGKAAALVAGAGLLVVGLLLLVNLAGRGLGVAGKEAVGPPARPMPFSDSTEAQTPASDPPEGGPVVLDPDGTGTDIFLDLDNGRLSSLPAGVSTPDGMLSWMRRSGADLLFAPQVSGTALLGADMSVKKLQGADQDAEAEAFFRAVAGVPAPRGAVRFGAGEEVPAAYAFRTREGSTGVLEILSFAAGSGGSPKLSYRPVPAD